MAGNASHDQTLRDSKQQREQRRPPVDKGVDFANYFCTYAFLYHQKDMLSDSVRMDAYYKAVFHNPSHFRNKIVLDVGTGSGILAIWAAKAGAKKVYAVETTNMAGHAAELIKSNGVQNIVDVIQASVEDVVLPEKVDVIISEWMGYFLVRESMLDSVIVARNRWLKPGGAMFPSHARMWLAPVRSGLGEQKLHDYKHSIGDWFNFVRDTNDRYGVNMHTLTEQYQKEQRKYFLQTALWDSLYPNQVVGTPVVIKEIDCATASLEEIESVQAAFAMAITTTSEVSGFAGWFDVHFRGTKEQPAEYPVELSTAPSIESTTHWGQQIFLLQPPLRLSLHDLVSGSISISRSKSNHQNCSHCGAAAAATAARAALSPHAHGI